MTVLQYRPEGQLTFAMRHGGVVVVGVEEKYRRCDTATESCSGRWQQRRVHLGS